METTNTKTVFDFALGALVRVIAGPRAGQVGKVINRNLRFLAINRVIVGFPFDPNEPSDNEGIRIDNLEAF